MILIADSGSTKADWVYGSSGQEGSFETKGMNPFFHDYRFINEELGNNPVASSIRDSVKTVLFFGAGCSSNDRNEIIANGLRMFFKDAHVIVEHDMLGCALSVCNGKPGIACILGTGSNTCYFNGSDIAPVRHGLGYVLGDEGSGSYFGRKLITSYLYRLMPEDIESKFSERYQLTKEVVLAKVYKEPDPNVYLASFAKFLSDNGDHPYIVNLVKKGMDEFVETNVLSYPESRSVPVHFVGSIAWFFREILSRSLEEHELQKGEIIQKPVQGLAAYFFSGGKMPE